MAEMMQPDRFLETTRDGRFQGFSRFVPGVSGEARYNERIDREA